MYYFLAMLSIVLSVFGTYCAHCTYSGLSTGNQLQCLIPSDLPHHSLLLGEMSVLLLMALRSKPQPPEAQVTFNHLRDDHGGPGVRVLIVSGGEVPAHHGLDV